MNKNMNNIKLDHRNSKMTFPLHSTSKSAFIFAMLHSFIWLVLYAVLTKTLMALIQTQATQYHVHNRMWFICDYERDIA